MFPNRRQWYWVQAGIVALVLCGSAAAQLIDDFNDGDDAGWTHIDLLNQVGLGPTVYDASAGSYQIASSIALPQTPSLVGTGSMWTASAADPQYSEGYMRLRFQAENGISNSFGAMRMNAATGDYYNFFTIPSGNGTIGISKVTAFTQNDDLVSMVFGITPGQWYWMETGAVGDLLTLKVWAETDPEPAQPQLNVVDTSFAAGGLVLGTYKFDDDTGVLSSRFDDVSFVPEPAALALLGMLMLMRRR
jgi:hypothetical protein